MPQPMITDGLNPELIDRIAKVLQCMMILGHPMRICQGFRTLAQQQSLYAQGRTAPGKIVTHADGIINKSNHQGGKAVDCCFLGADPFAETHPWRLYGEAVKAVGLTWGGDFSTLVDKPHAEWYSGEVPKQSGGQ